MQARDADIELGLLLEAIYRKYHYDFREYSMASIRRRLAQALTALGCPTLSQLQERVLHDPAVFAALLQFLTVQVSDMFRDPSYFRAIREKVVPVLADLSLAEDLGGGLQHGRGGVLAGDPAAGGGPARPDAHLRHGHQCRQPPEGRGGRVRRSIGSPGSRRNYQQAGGKASLSDYYTAAYGSAVFDKSLQDQHASSRTTAWRPTASSPRCSSSRVATCSSTSTRALQDRAVGLFRDALCRQGLPRAGRQGEPPAIRRTPPPSRSSCREDRIYQKD